MYTKLFEQGKIGNIEIKNRLVMAPMGTGIANLDGTPSEDLIQYYEERAKGGCGLIYTEVCRVNDVHGAALLRQLSMTKDRNVAPMAQMVNRVHKYGTKMFCQLHHPGRETKRALIGGQLCVGASDKKCKFGKEETRALSGNEVKELIQNYITAAVRARKAGFDGVEIHCAHGYLPGQFFSPYTNNRTDEYGGCFENRMRFVVEILEGIHKECGDDYVVTCRISADELLDMYGIHDEHIRRQDGVEIARALEKAGAAAINVSCGIYETGVPVIEPTTWEQGWKSYLIKPIKEAVSIPVIAVNNIREPAVAEQLLEEEVLDFVAMGRSWIADPQWGTKAMEGRESEIRRCIGCLRCFESLSKLTARNYHPECSVNPKAFKERKFHDEQYDINHHRVAVIGAGPAGMCAALTCAKRGMKVTLIEKSDRLGGLLNYASLPPHKDRLNWMTEWYESELPKSGVELMLNTEATVDVLKTFMPDAVIISTGAKPITPNIPGKDRDNVYDVYEALDGRAGLKNKKVIVVGAGITGLETAAYLNENQCDTTVIDMLEKAAPNGNERIVEDALIRLEKKDTAILLGQQLLEILPDGVRIKDLNSEKEQTLSCDAVVLSLGFKPEKAHIAEIEESFSRVYKIGSVVDAGCSIHGATNSAYRCARDLFTEKKDAGFKLSVDEVSRFGKEFLMLKQEGIVTAFLTDPDVVKELLPPPLQPFSLPVITFSLCHVNNPSFADPYYEAVLGTYCTLDGKLGSFPIQLLLCGDGAEMAQLAGRDIASWPKKIADECILRKEEDTVTASVTRHGTELVKVKIKLGQYNHPMMHTLYQAPEPGKVTKGLGYCYKFDHMNHADGSIGFGNVRLLGNLCEYHYTDWKPGFAEIELRSGADDPWGSIPVSTVIGGAYQTNDLNLPVNYPLVSDIDTENAIPYILTQRYDRTMLMEKSKF